MKSCLSRNNISLCRNDLYKHTASKSVKSRLLSRVMELAPSQRFDPSGDRDGDPSYMQK